MIYNYLITALSVYTQALQYFSGPSPCWLAALELSVISEEALMVFLKKSTEDSLGRMHIIMKILTTKRDKLKVGGNHSLLKRPPI